MAGSRPCSETVECLGNVLILSLLAMLVVMMRRQTPRIMGSELKLALKLAESLRPRFGPWPLIEGAALDLRMPHYCCNAV